MDRQPGQCDDVPFSPNVTGTLTSSRSGRIGLLAAVVAVLTAVAISYAWHRLREETVPVVAPALQSRYEALRASLEPAETQFAGLLKSLRFRLSASGPQIDVARTLRDNPQLAGEWSAVLARHAELLTLLSPYEQALLFCRERPERCQAMADEVIRMTVHPFGN